ncbi:MAG: serine/threonine protein kinase [Lachnospiraceae bacterium]|nr:serine/threonine protein kinase [Lachnospiraceae bacterium]
MNNYIEKDEVKKLEKRICNRYDLIELIGTGGNGCVYKAKDIKTGKFVALKCFKASDVMNKKRISKEIMRELNVLKYITHPGLPKVFDVIYENGCFYLVMEYIEGATLKETLKKKRMKKKDIRNISVQIMSALYYIHSLEPPIVYRDLKPENIIIMEDNKVKLIDFGNAKRFNRDVAADTFAMGSPKYAAPEQFGDRFGNGLYNTDIRTDIYSMGILLYYMATLETNVGEASFFKKIRYYILFDRKYRKTIIKATQKSPKNRFQNIIEMMVSFG